MKLTGILSALVLITSAARVSAAEAVSWDPPLRPVGPATPRPPEPAPVPPTPEILPTPPRPAPSYNTFAAIAYSYSTGKFGRSTNQPDAYTAIQAARGQCGVEDCHFTHWVTNGCMGLARSEISGVSFSYAPDTRGAGAFAYDNCERSFGRCGLVTTVCSAGFR